LLGRRSGPLPIVEVRDLLGLVRALWRTGKDGGASKAYLEQLERIGRRLQLALELAASGPGTTGERAAWNHAELACDELGRVVEAFLPADEVVKAARRAVVGGGTSVKRRKEDER
jgi:hypothetical protein